jgi:multiple sugar transport system substrate-binding protein
MYSRVDLSLAGHLPAAIQVLRQVVERYEQSHQNGVQLTIFGWDTIWKDLVNVGIYKRGADLSEIGTTWIGSFVSMNALRAFRPAEIAQLGGEQAFLPMAWRTTSLVGDTRVWAIPFLSDVRVIFYWRDMLEQAGVDETTAFASFESMQAAFKRLKSIIPAPWAVPTDASTQDTLHNASSWVWASGGDFVSPDGRKTRFAEPGARRALQAYFSLYRFMPKGIHPISGAKMVDLFRQRQVAAVLGGPWLLADLRGREEFASQKAKIGIALPPGPSFVGGTNLVIWQHTRSESECIEMIRYLVSPQVQNEICLASGHLPVRMEALADPVYTADPHLKVLVEALHTGCVPITFPLWGMVEDKLSASFVQVWSELFAQRHDRLEVILSRHLEGLARRLDLLLGS